MILVGRILSYSSMPGANLTEIAPCVPEVHVGAQPCVLRADTGGRHTEQANVNTTRDRGIHTKATKCQQGIYIYVLPIMSRCCLGPSTYEPSTASDGGMNDAVTSHNL